MTAGTLGAGENEIKGSGIISGHAYTLMGAYDIADKNGKKVRLVKMRNPWGEKEWNGAWGDNDPNWTPELRKELKVEKVNDGVFFMELLDYLKYFDHTCVCMDVPENYVTKSLIYDGNKIKKETD